MKPRIPVLILPKYLRKSLRIPLSRLYVSRGWITGFKADYTVGDIVSQNNIGAHEIIDGKTLREEIHVTVKGVDVINPPGSLALNTITMLKCRFCKSYIVHGEEDLVTLGVCREYFDKKVIYGQPSTGIVLMKSNPYWAINVIKAFKPDIVDYEE